MDINNVNKLIFFVLHVKVFCNINYLCFICCFNLYQIIIIIIIIIIIGILPLGRFAQRPELSQATGMALVRCILGKFLGVVCHCFPHIYIYSTNIPSIMIINRIHETQNILLL